MARRLTTTLIQVIKGDKQSARGQQTITKGDLKLLQGFEFNERSKMSSVFHPTYTIGVDRAIGDIETSIPPFIPSTSVTPPPDTSHMKISVLCAEIDFTNGTYKKANIQATDLIPWNKVPTAPILLINKVEANTQSAIITVVGIEFFETFNSETYPTAGGAAKSSAIASISVFS